MNKVQGFKLSNSSPSQLILGKPQNIQLLVPIPTQHYFHQKLNLIRRQTVAKYCMLSHLLLLLFSSNGSISTHPLNSIRFYLCLHNMWYLMTLPHIWIITGYSIILYPPRIDKHRQHNNICLLFCVFSKYTFAGYI